MRFGPVAVAEAEGAILAHSLGVPGGRLRKGLVLDAAAVARLVAGGHQTVVVARPDPDDVGEDEAALALGIAVTGANVVRGEARTGRVNLFAGQPGVLVVDAASIDAINAVHEGITVATLPQHALVQQGELLGTVKIIPYAVPGSLLETAITRAESPVRVAPLLRRTVALVLSELPGLPARLLDNAEQAQRDRLTQLGSPLLCSVRVPHTPDAVAEALEALLATHEVVLFLGASAIVDRADVLPAALERIGGTIDHFGIPVDPGNLLLLGHRGARTVLGLPGCARSLKPSGFDVVLRRVLAGVPPDTHQLRRLGVGGLLKEIPTRPSPRAPSTGPHRVTALVLAAGRSRRMGADNKLLAEVDGVPLVRRAVDTLCASGAERVLVVTGHDAEAVRHALVGAGVELVHNPDFAQGLSTSLRAGLDAVGEHAQGVMVALGDMPFVRTEDVDRLLAAFDPAGGAAICQPVHERKRGHPVLWARRFFPELRGLTGDEGARDVLAAHADEVHLVEVSDAGVHVDVDTPEALARVREGARDDYRDEG